MKGLLLTHKSKTSKEITQINNILFGRVIQVTRKNRKYYYYYQGEFSNTKYYKINKGCYFILTEKPISVIDNINTIPCDIFLKEDMLVTPSDYFKEKYKDIEVVNL